MCLQDDGWIKDGTISSREPPSWTAPQKVMRFTSYQDEEHAGAHVELIHLSPCFTYSKALETGIFSALFSSSYQQTSWVMTGRLALMRSTGNRSRDLGCLGAAERPSLPASPCQTKEKRWRTSTNSCQSCHALRRRLSLDERLVEIPAETCRPASPPPVRRRHYLLVLYADLFHFTVFSSAKTLLRARDRSLITLRNAWKYN